MVECRTNGPPGASAPTGAMPLCGANPREGQAPPLRRRTNAGAKPGAPHPPQCAHWGTFPSRGRQAGRRGRRPRRARGHHAAQIRGRGKPLPYGGAGQGPDVYRDSGRMISAPTRGCEAVGLGAGRTAGRRGRRPLRARRHSPGAKPRAADSRPYGRGRTLARNRQRDVEDAGPYRMVQKTGVVRKPREGQAPPLRGRRARMRRI